MLTTYGRSSGFCVDPIEKKPLNHFLPGSSVLSFGTAGCNLACRFCQNWDISKSKEHRHARRRRVARRARRGRPGASAAAASRSRTTTRRSSWSTRSTSPTRAATPGIASVAVTAGYICPEPRRDFYAHIDAANVDLKAFTEDFYHHVCGAHLRDVLDTLEYLVHETDVWVEITNLLIPGQERQRRGSRRDDALDRRAPRPRCPDALHRVPSRLQDARRPSPRRRRR